MTDAGMRRRILKKGEEGANLPSPGFADDAAKQAAKAYRNGTSAATFPAFSLSPPHMFG